MGLTAPAPERPPAPRKRRRWWIEVAVVALAFVIVQSFVTRGVVRGPLPPLSGVLADGSAIDAARWQSEQGGGPFLLYVWAAWCSVCRVIEGNIDDAARALPVLTVAMQSGSRGDVQRLLASRGLDWPTLVDETGALARGLGVDAVPTLLFVDGDGRVRAATRGYTSRAGIRLRMWWAARS